MKSKAALVAPLVACAPPLLACPQCRPLVQAGVQSSATPQNIAVLMLPLLVIALVGAALYFCDSISLKRGESASWQATAKPSSVGR